MTATVMSVRFARQLAHQSQKELKEHFKSFINATKEAVDVRDMREHSDECFIGNGANP